MVGLQLSLFLCCTIEDMVGISLLRLKNLRLEENLLDYMTLTKSLISKYLLVLYFVWGNCTAVKMFSPLKRLPSAE